MYYPSLQLGNTFADVIDLIFYQKVPTSIWELPSQKEIYAYISQWSDRGYFFFIFQVMSSSRGKIGSNLSAFKHILNQARLHILTFSCMENIKSLQKDLWERLRYPERSTEVGASLAWIFLTDNTFKKQINKSQNPSLLTNNPSNKYTDSSRESVLPLLSFKPVRSC